MNDGLDLEVFLRLLRADLGSWASLGAIVLFVALLTWTNWGSRRALRKCLVLSIAVHIGLVVYGSIFYGRTLPFLVFSPPTDRPDPDEPAIRKIQVTPVIEGRDEAPGIASPDGRTGGKRADWDEPEPLVSLNDPALGPTRREPSAPDLAPPRLDPLTPPIPRDPEVNPPEPAGPESRPPAAETTEEPTLAPPIVAQGDAEEIAAAVIPGRGEDETGTEADPKPTADRRLRPEHGEPGPDRTAIARVRPTAPDLPETRGPDLPATAPGAPEIRPDSTPEPAEVALTAPIDPEGIATPARGPRSAETHDLAMALPDDSGLRNRARRPGPDRPKSRSVPRPRPPIPSAPSPGRINGIPDEGPGLPGERPEVRETGGPVASAEPPSLPDAMNPPSRFRPSPERAPALAEVDLRRGTRPAQVRSGRSPFQAQERSGAGLGPIAMSRVTPSGIAGLAPVPGTSNSRPLSDIPEVYRSRLDPNRSALAQRAGASPASEQAVERALDWLARHQDIDGRWDGGTAKYPDGSVAKGEDNFTKHCPPGEICAGECFYWEADTAMTGLALLAYLGAGYTHTDTDSKYADVVDKGIDYLLLAQKPDGDLRGSSKKVGMYCHAMAALALSEAYAMTGDRRLRVPVERAVDFIVKSRARDGMSWRYAPGAVTGDTSILGWMVLVLKSAKVVGVRVPPAAQAGTLSWLKMVSAGHDGGLARYQPFKAEDPTMTAEAWVCRQFLGVGGPGASSQEAAEYLFVHGPDRDPYNLYYWYYGTLAMYQYGGESWARWNGQVRDQLVRRQRLIGHQAGSWDPDESQYGTYGGRIYSTALATLTLEVYYRYLRLYDELGSPPILAPAPERPGDPTLRRAGNAPDPGRWRRNPTAPSRR